MALYFRFVLLIVFSGVFSNLSVAQDTPNTVLWKIEGKDIQPSYLFGTIHLLPKSDFVLKKKVENAFMETDILVLELDMDDPALQGKMMQHAVMKDGQTLDELFTEEDYAAIDAQLQASMGVSLTMFNTFKPFMLAAFLVAPYVGEQPASFEASLVAMAKTQNKEIEGLETVEQQMALFDRFPYKDQAEDIVEMIHDKEKTQAIFMGLVGVYKEENISSMATMMEEYFNGPDEMEILLNERNRNWIPAIEAKAKEQSTFFGVGAGHLGGDQGVIALLKEAGYTVTPVME